MTCSEAARERLSRRRPPDADVVGLHGRYLGQPRRADGGHLSWTTSTPWLGRYPSPRPVFHWKGRPARTLPRSPGLEAARNVAWAVAPPESRMGDGWTRSERPVAPRPPIGRRLTPPARTIDDPSRRRRPIPLRLTRFALTAPICWPWRWPKSPPRSRVRSWAAMAGTSATITVGTGGCTLRR